MSTVMATGVNVVSNRAGELFAQAAARVSTRLCAGTTVRFSYWATFYGDNPEIHDDDIQLIARRVTNLAENKGWLARQVEARGLTWLFPRTCFSVEEALRHNDTCALWFSKPVHLSGGRGIECVRRCELATYVLPEHHVLQQGVEKLMLLEQRKFTGRIYVLVWQGRLWLFDDGFILLHGVPFDETSNSYAIHVEHRGYEKDDSAVEMRLLSSLEGFQQHWSALSRAVYQLQPLFQELVDASGTNRYVMLGIDFLLQADGGLQFIEVNCIPNFIHSPMINQQLNVPFFEHAIALMCGLPATRLHAPAA